MYQLLEKLNKLNIRLSLKDNNLDIQAAKGIVNKALLDEIKYHKLELIDFLQNAEEKLYIEKVTNKSHYPLSSAQKRLWLLQNMNPENTSYHIPLMFEIQGYLDHGKLEEIFNHILIKHESLRTIFQEDGKGNPIQIIKDPESVPFNIIFKGIVGHISNEEIQKIINKPFNLSEDCLLRVCVFSISENKHVLLMVMHHIISDGWSIDILAKDFIDAYSLGQIFNDKKLSIQYKDYAVWQQKQIKSEKHNIAKEYWFSIFSDEIPVLNLPTYQNRPKYRNGKGETLFFQFDNERLILLSKLCAKHKVSLFMGLISLVDVLLYKYSQQKDIVIGTPIANREISELQDQIGFYANTLAIRTKLDTSKSFVDLLANNRQTLLNAYKYQDYPFDELISDLNLRYDPSRNPLFDVMVSLQENQKSEIFSIKDLTIKRLDIDNHTSKFDLLFNFFIDNGELNLALTFDSDLYNDLTCQNIIKHFECLLNKILDNPNLSLKTINYLTEEERKQLLSNFNNTNVVFPQNKTIIDLFEEQVDGNPDNVAVVFNEKRLTYKDLNAQANQLAHYLRENYAIQPDDLIAIKLDRSERMIVAILGILKSGGAYVPIDPEYPEDRIEYIEKDIRAKVLIDKLFLDEFENGKDRYAKTNLSKINAPENSVYVIYTSGTTGQPKGVMIENRSLVNYLLFQRDYLNFENEKVALLTAYTFDASAEQIFLSLLNSSTLFILSKDVINSDNLSQVIYDKGITHIHSVPSLLNSLSLDDIPPLKRIISAGDKYDKNLTKKYFGRYALYNKYGPTESTISVLINRISSLEDTSIGYPIANTQIYILDEGLQPVPIGVTGKLYVSGAGLARDYLNNPELTAEKFIPNPFIEGTRMYDTGDLGHWLPDGNIEFLGRNDFQVKIRGYRIELGEIESHLSQYSGSINQVVADARDVNGEKVLVAYYTTKEKDSIDKSDLRQYLQGKLPEYMVPGYFVEIENIPLTPNGKTDRKALPGISGDDLIHREYVSPKTATEVKLVDIWQEVLGIDRVGITDNFFELGGHSLMVAQVLNRMYQSLSHSISFKDFFAEPTITGISHRLEEDTYTPIPKAPEQASYPLTPSQQRLWILSQLDGGSQAYNMPAAVTLAGDLDKERLEQAFRLLIERHEILRTSFKADSGSGEIRQCIIPKEEVQFRIETKDFTGKDKKEIEAYLHKINGEAFDLELVPLVRASLLQTGDGEYVFFLCLHHIIGDGWSTQILISEIVDTYNNLGQGKEAINDSLKVQYKDYSVWLQGRRQRDDYKKAESYWLEQFRGELPVLEMPSYKVRPLIQTYNGDSINHIFTEEFTNKLKAFSERHDATLFMTLMAGVKALLYKYTNQKDLIIGTPIAGREHPDLENQIGLYLNTLAIRTQLEKLETFKSLLIKEKALLLEAYENQAYPFDELVGKLNLKRDISRSALFDVMAVYQNQATLQLGSKVEDIEGLLIESYDFDRKTSQFDISFIFGEYDNRLALTIGYNTDIYDQDLMNRMLSHFENLIDQAIDHETQSLETISYLTEEEKQQLLLNFNNTKAVFPQNKTIIDLFEQQVDGNPDNVAVVFNEKRLTYKDLNAQANQLGSYLRENYTVQPDDLIAIKLDRSERMIVAILGILKSGGAYVPIDLEYPEDRITYIETDTQAKVMIDTLFLNEFEKVKDRYPKTNLPQINTPENLVYVIYTSGTTGQPKGVMIENRSLVNYLLFQRDYLNFEKEKVALLTAYTFDPSAEQIFLSLLNSSTLFILPKDIINSDSLSKAIYENKVTHIHSVPSLLTNLSLDDIPSIKRIISAGEKYDTNLTKKYFGRYVLYNKYGPTESTISVLINRISSLDDTSIGSPTANTQVYILDEGLQPVPIGVTGKLYVSGAGLARGYLNKPELTAEKFIPNPFIEGTRMYDTGDLGRWLPDGNIEFLGRDDFQVKIRGYRIELGEIESHLSQYSGSIGQVVADARDVNGEKVLVAYYTTKEKDSIDKSDLRQYLQGKLPEYMVPGFFVEIENIPLTPNGKTDRKALPGISGDDLIHREYVAPRTDTEAKLVEIWQEILDIDRVGITDNFFELGGHSLMVAQIINRMHQFLSLTVSFKDFFAGPTIANVSDRLEEEKYVPIPKAPEQESYPLTPSQQRLWVLSQLDGGSLAYNMPAAVTLSGNLDKDKLEQAFRLLIDKHEILRTSFKAEPATGEIRQYIIPNEEIQFRIETKDFTGKDAKDIEAYLHKINGKPFNLELAPLVRASLLQIGNGEYVFFLCLHHIISDGWSTHILVSEIVKTYNNLCQGIEAISNSLKIQYKDYSVWMQEKRKGVDYKKAESYWLEQFKGELPVLELLGYKTRPSVQTYNGNKINYLFCEELTSKIKIFLEENDVTLFMTLMAGIKALLYKYTNQKDLIVGTPIAGREHPDLEDQIGLYLNTLAIRTGVEELDTFRSLLEKEKEVLLGAYEHQLYPFDELVGKLNLKRGAGRSAVFDVMVILQNQNSLQLGSKIEDISGLKVYGYDFYNKTAQFDISYIFVEYKNRLSLTIGYNTDIYDESLITRMFSHFENLINNAIDQEDIALKDLEYLTEGEKHQLLETFNDTQISYPRGKTIIDLFEERVSEFPEHIAVIGAENGLTYSQLDKASDNVSSYLTGKHGMSNEPIGVVMERNPGLIVILLGILKSGKSYIPIDPALPPDRISYIIRQSRTPLIITDSSLPAGESPLIPLDQSSVVNAEELLDYEQPAPGIKHKPRPSDTAYIIYTSGSTGNPKGVEIGHKALQNFCTSIQMSPGIKHEDILYSVTTYSFDISILEFFTPLISGATVFIAGKDTLRNMETLKEELDRVNPTILQATPSFYQMLFNNGWHGNKTLKILCGGDSLNESLAEKLVTHTKEVWNMYGPTETTIWSSMKKVENPGDASNIGKPINNTQIYILDKYRKLLPLDAIGRIYIAGDGLAKGYYNNPVLTAEKFMPNPFMEGALMYDTGDLGRWLPDGDIEFLGRDDFQVKVRGYRIELEEIETHISQYSDSIGQVVADAREVHGEKVLVAYYTSREEGGIDKTDLRKHLQGKLPEYMVPGYFVELESIPLTPNGKTDRKALPGISGEDLVRREYVAPRNATEAKLVEIWQEVLGIDRIGVTDNFFELGGHSLMVAQVLNRMYQSLSRSINFKDFFVEPTIANVSNKLKEEAYIPISKAPEQKNYPLTPSQQRLWVLSQLEGGSLAYNMPAVIILSGLLDSRKLDESFRLLIARHEILRTSFRSDNNGEIRQYITPMEEVHFNIPIIDFMGKSSEEVDNYLHNSNNEVFVLEESPLIRASLLKRSDTEHVFFFSIHHIIGDGWSTELLISEIVENYNLLLQDKSVIKPSLSIQYKDYAVWLESEMNNERYKKSESYWLSQFAGELPILELPGNRPRPSMQTYNGNILSHTFSYDFTEKLKIYSKSHGATLFMTVMAGVKALLHRYTGQNDIIVGTPIAGREHPDLENQIGLYLNTLAIRTRFEERANFYSLLEQEKELLLDAYEHQSYPFDELVGKLNIKWDTSRSALFDVMVVFQNQHDLIFRNRLNDAANLKVSDYKFCRKTSQFDLTYTFSEYNDNLSLVIEYNTDIYDEELIYRMFSHFENLLVQAIRKDIEVLDKINYLTIEEHDVLITKFNNSEMNYPKDKTIIDLFEEQVIKTPNELAIITQDVNLSYIELEAKINNIAQIILEQIEIIPNTIIAIRAERSIEMVAAIYAILKTGSAYLPINPKDPIDRVKFILSDSQSKLLLSYSEDTIDVEDICKVLDLRTNISTENKANIIKKKISPSDLAYIIYTSGTTGHPKGVSIEHHSLSNIIYTLQRKYSLNKNDVYLLKTNYVFDVSVAELFGWFLGGAKLAILEKGNEMSPEAILNFIEIKGVTHINFVPSMFNVFVNELNKSNISKIKSLKYLFLAGEALRNDLVDKFNKIKGATKIVNLYGPTEATVYASEYCLDDYDQNRQIPIGKPIDNVQIYIFDKEKRPVPIGITGELYIGGEGIARGYLNNENLTSEKFFYSSLLKKRLYRTGDLGRWLSNGDIEYLGRSDFQVKIRGFRIELGEIETCAQKIDGIREVLVIPRDDNKNEPYLCLYYTTLNTEIYLVENEIINHLKNNLPYYMIPSYIIKIDRFETTANGKLNRNALPIPKHKNNKEFIMPTGRIEKELIEIWSEVLNIDSSEISTNYNFFELGGNSLSVMRVISKIYLKFGIKLNIDDIFKNNEISVLSEFIAEKDKDKSFYSTPIEKIPNKEYYDTYSEQIRLYEKCLNNEAYNIRMAFKINKIIDKSKLEEILKKVIYKYEILRTSFHVIDNKLYQKIYENVDLNIEYINKTGIEDYISYINNYIDDNHLFDLSKYPLYRFKIFDVNNDEYVLFFEINHMIIDGWGINILKSEIASALLNNTEIIPLEYQYKDVVNWLNSYVKSSEFKSDMDFWHPIIADYKRFNIKTDFVRPKKRTFNGNSISLKLDKSQNEFFKTFSQENNTTNFVTFVSIINILLYKVTECSDIILGTSVSIRDSQHLENQLGVFVNNLLVRNNVVGEQSFLSFFYRVRSRMESAFNHKNLPLSLLADKIKYSHDPAHHFLYDIYIGSEFKIGNKEDNIASSSTVPSISVFPLRNKFYCKYDIIFLLNEGENLEIHIMYNTDLFRQTTVENIRSLLNDVVLKIMTNQNVNINDI